MRIVAKNLISRGTTSLVFDGIKTSAFASGRVAIKVMNRALAIDEAAKYLLVDEGFGSLIDVVSLNDIAFSDAYASVVKQEFPGGDLACLVLKFLRGERFIYTEPLVFFQAPQKDEWLLHTYRQDGSVFAYRQGFLNNKRKWKVNFLKSLISEVAKFHRKGAYHGDISPQNVLYINGELKLVDYGGAFTAGSPGWTTKRKGIASDIECVGLWMSRAFKKSDKTLGRIGQKAIEGEYASLDRLNESLEAWEKKQHRKGMQYAIMVMTLFALVSVLLVHRFSSGAQQKPPDYQLLYQDAVANPRARTQILRDFRQTFHYEPGSRKTIFPYLVKLGSETSLSGEIGGVWRFSNTSGVFFGNGHAQPGDKALEAYVFDVYFSQIIFANELGKLLHSETIPEPYSQLNFGCFSRNIDTKVFFNAIANLSNVDFVDFTEQNGDFKIGLYLPVKSAKGLLKMIASDPRTKVDFDKDFLLYHMPQRFALVSHPSGSLIQPGNLIDLLWRVNLFEEYILEIPEPLKGVYIPRLVLPESMNTAELMAYVCQIGGVQSRISQGVFKVE